MDVDANAISTERRLTALERFLDIEAPGWRDMTHRSRRYVDSSLAARAHPDMHVDDEQTARDRAALGFDRTEDAGDNIGDESLPSTGASAGNDDQSGAGQQQKSDPVREQVLRDLEPFRGVEGYAQWDGTEPTNILQAMLTISLERKAAVDRARQES